MNLAVVRGEPDDVELAALVAGLAAGLASGSGPAPDGDDAARSRWRRAASLGPAPVTPGPDAWKWSRR